MTLRRHRAVGVAAIQIEQVGAVGRDRGRRRGRHGEGLSVAREDRQLDRPLVAVDQMGERRVPHQDHALELVRADARLDVERTPAADLRGGVLDLRPRAPEHVRRLEHLEARVATVVRSEAARDLDVAQIERGDRRVPADEDPAIGQQRRRVVVGPWLVALGDRTPGPRLGVIELGLADGVLDPRPDDRVAVGAVEGDHLAGRQQDPVEYQRGREKSPVGSVVSASPAAVSIVVRRLSEVAT